MNNIKIDLYITYNSKLLTFKTLKQHFNMNLSRKEIEDIQYWVEDYKNQMELKLWRINLNEDTDTPNWDIYDEFIICAHSETEARELAASECGDEGEEVWLNNNLSTIEIIADTTRIKVVEVVMSSYNSG